MSQNNFTQQQQSYSWPYPSRANAVIINIEYDDSPETCCKGKVTKEKVTDEKVAEDVCNRKGCEKTKESGEYVSVGNDNKIYIKNALNKFYPELRAEIIDEIKAKNYYVEQFGIKVTDCNENPKDVTFITWRGSMNAGCIGIPPNNTCAESYNTLQNAKGDWHENCKSNIFNDSAHVVSAKAYYHKNTIDKDKPIATLSQNQPLIIADKKTHKLISKDGKIINKTTDECKEFFDSDNRITSCTEKGEDCEVCREALWDFQDVVPVFFE